MSMACCFVMAQLKQAKARRKVSDLNRSNATKIGHRAIYEWYS